MFTLKDDLIEHHDYEAVLPKVWEYLVSWYGTSDSEPILRPVRYDVKKRIHFIDLYLEYNNQRFDEIEDSEEVKDSSENIDLVSNSQNTNLDDSCLVNIE